ncbi:hypothetical protein GYMLUDRAFT_244719 [Collybiopsis luxurians FD-317 M1]|uniref:Uncharacterized protein n=1 Tax=Collybiopsis luxurians FD-317 M1 TaxID=944289 RepID=A0A0D0CBS4_9AGAR|nr:hypothetical protein GYMLUDRAFT_244719 [Collybiopsis luxurians FD-317 M1]
MARLFTVGSGLIGKWERLVSRSYESLDDIKKVQDEIKTGVIPAMISYSVPSFFIDSTKYPNMTRVKCCASYSKKDGNFKAAEWSSGLRKPQPSGGEIFGAEDDEDNELASDSDLMLLHQHMGDYIDSDEEVDPNPNHPPASKTSNASSESPKLYTKPCPQTSTFSNPAIKLHNPPTSSYLNARHSSTIPNPQSTRQQAHCLLVVITSALAPTVKPYAYQLILTRTPLPALPNLPNPLIVVLLYPPANFSVYGHGPWQ